MKINGFDIDGVIHLGNGVCGVRPGPNDVIITGRSYEEEPETKAFLHRHGIKNRVYFNPLPFEEKSRQSSGAHKARTLKFLKHEEGIEVQFFFEDDVIQKEEIEESWNGKVIHVSHDFTEKENVRHLEDLDE
jgi:hypothetical protein|tara:strand:- start:71 stop:466 length:396 start_codon:yes stop_codon:yes gene_type:complete